MEPSFLTRQDIINFPFPYKLWLMVQLDFCDFLRWNRDGTVLLLDLAALEDYLNSARSIFKIKNRSAFLTHLKEFQFERLNATPEDEEDILMQYKNKYFQRYRLDLLGKIRRQSHPMLEETSSDGKCFKDSKSYNNNEPDTKPIFDGKYALNVAKSVSENIRTAEHMTGDLCFMYHGCLSKIQTGRLLLQMILSFQNESKTLQEKLRHSDENTVQKRRIKTEPNSGKSTGGNCAMNLNNSALMDEEQVIELPIDLFENPHDSVLHVGDDFRPEYAGYYGNCRREQILHAFGDYLPMYEDGSMEVRKILTDSHGTTQNVSSDGERDQYLQNLAQIKPEQKTVITPQMIQCNNPNMNFSSSLEPIFKTEEDQENYNYVGASATQIAHSSMQSETELTMDEFIKFKNASLKNNNLQIIKTEKFTLGPGAVEPFPQMPAAVKMEITDQGDTQENEENFRNFFSQYRASLNLLYERF